MIYSGIAFQIERSTVSTGLKLVWCGLNEVTHSKRFFPQFDLRLTPDGGGLPLRSKFQINHTISNSADHNGFTSFNKKRRINCQLELISWFDRLISHTHSDGGA